MNRETRTVSFDLCMGAIGKSGRVLHAFTEFYLTFYAIDPTFLFEHFSVFGCISAAVYCVDESVEQELLPKKGAGIDDLENLLTKRIEIDGHIAGLLRDAREYCAFEQASRAGGAEYDLQEVLRVSEIRSVDFRLMHHALLQIAKIPYDEEVFEWFRAFEVLMEIEDDLSSIQEDERRGGYNYYCFARKVAGKNVGGVVESVRVGLEERVKAIGNSLRHRGFTRCASVMERYRQIVPRRPVPIKE